MSWQSEGFYNRPLLIRTAFDMIRNAINERRYFSNSFRGVLGKRESAIANHLDSCILYAKPSTGDGTWVDPTQPEVFPGVPLTTDRIEELIGFSLYSGDFNLSAVSGLDKWIDALAAAESVQYVAERYGGFYAGSYRWQGYADGYDWNPEGVQAAYQAACADALSRAGKWNDTYGANEVSTTVSPYDNKRKCAVTVRTTEIHYRAVGAHSAIPECEIDGTGYYRTTDINTDAASGLIGVNLGRDIMDDPGGDGNKKFFALPVLSRNDFIPLPDVDYDNPIQKKQGFIIYSERDDFGVRCTYDFKYK